MQANVAGLEEVEQITFNQIKQIWIQKMKSELTKVRVLF